VVGYTLQPQPALKETQNPSDGRLGRTDSRKAVGGEGNNLLESFMMAVSLLSDEALAKLCMGFPRKPTEFSCHTLRLKMLSSFPCICFHFTLHNDPFNYFST
jgi:hypothetical protein